MKHTIIVLKSNITIEFADTIQYRNKATIDYYLNLILSELNFRFEDWKKTSSFMNSSNFIKNQINKRISIIIVNTISN
jgi:hypothetical protein